VIVGVGIDVVQVVRLERALARTPTLAGRLFTDTERQLSRVESLAARFAAKEAVAKALGAPGGLRWRTPRWSPTTPVGPGCGCTAAVAEEAEAQGISTWHLSMSHDAGVATAVVVAES
jgi:holo-[acyl-carrier protein] synthase